MPSVVGAKVQFLRSLRNSSQLLLVPQGSSLSYVSCLLCRARSWGRLRCVLARVGKPPKDFRNFV